MSQADPPNESHEPAAGCGGYEPCACCRALAQVRMPWIPQNVPVSPAQSAAPAPEPKQPSKPEAKTQFFKLPGFGKKQSAKEAPREAAANASDAANDSAAAEDTTEGPGDKDWNEEEDDNPALHIPKPQRMWQGLEGLAISAMGIAIPAFLLLASIGSAPKRFTLVLLNHPIETIIELLLIALIPVVNYLVWSTICKKRTLSRGLNIALGANIATALIVSGTAMAGLIWGEKDLANAIGTDFSGGFTWISLLTLAAGGASAYMANKIRKSWELPQSRARMLTYSTIGFLIAAGAFAASEFRPWCVRLAERMAVSASAKDRQVGLQQLRQMNPERELRMECSDSRAAGVAGLFIPLKSSTQHQLYFALTGTPYSFREFNNTDMSSMPDDYLCRHVVGDRVKGMTLTRSNLSGAVHPESLSATIDWTFVLKNGTSIPQEGRAELGLPPGAAITSLKVWTRGEVQDAMFVASDKVDGLEQQNVGHDSPAIVTDLGRGRVLLHAYPVPEEAEMKVSMRIVVPVKPDGSNDGVLALPRVIASNFDLDGEHVLRLRSEQKMSSSQKNITPGLSPAGQKILSGTLTAKQLEDTSFEVRVKRNADVGPVAVLDRLAIQMRQEDEKKAEQKRREAEAASNSENKGLGEVMVMIDGSKGVRGQLEDLQKMINRKQDGHKKKTKIKTILPQYVVQDLTRIAAPAPKHLVVVIDGSVSMKSYIGEVEAALKKLPAGIPTSVLIASQEQEQFMQPASLASRLASLGDVQFIGGQDNLQAVVKAAELAGETKGSAVLWIHGPQPVINEEIYIMAPYTATPSFYELAVGSGTDTFQFFKNHSEIGPFNMVPRNSTHIADDLTAFFSKWKANSNEYVIAMAHGTTKPIDAKMLEGDAARELLTLNAVRECNRLVAAHKMRRAARIAVNYGFVSPVSSAVVGLQAPAVETDEDEALEPQYTENITGTGNNTGAQSSDSVDNSAPYLQGATNGTIGPQGGEAKIIQGINTAGTVRVNNLANLEALLNIFANLGEILGLVGGAALAINGMVNKSVTTLGKDIELGPGGRIVAGVLLAIIGLMTPGVINWFVASARDANLFS